MRGSHLVMIWWPLLIAIPSAAADAGPATCFAVSGEVAYWGSTLLNQWRGVNRSLYGELQSFAPEAFQGWACVDMRQWDSGNTTRDKHAQIMFEVERYPEACYLLQETRLRSTSVWIRGLMEIHGVQRPLIIEGRLERQGSDFRLKAQFLTRISDWGMKPPRLMAVMNVRDETRVEIDATLRPTPCGRVRRGSGSGGSPPVSKAIVYEAYCSFCHMPQGQGQGYYPPITHVATFLRHPEGRSYLARVVLYGLFGPIEVGEKKYDGFLMPPFGEDIDDEMLARLLNEILFILSPSPPSGVLPYTPEEVRRYRNPPALPSDMWHIRQKIVRDLRQSSPS